VSEDEKTPYERAMAGHLRTRVGRSQFLMATGAGIVAAAYPRTAGAQTTTPETVMAQVHYQIGGTEAEHRVVARATLALLGQADVPPNNKAFQTDTAFYLANFYKMYRDQGFIGGPGQQVTYPGRDAALAAAGLMVALVLNTTP